ncbi:MAG: cation diffusion facilitator family transporter [Conexivisphaera sp.]|jgi:cation diffusion facilitator family transporter
MSEGTRRAVRTALASNLALLVLKLSVALITGSSVMFAESLHSLMDSFNQIFLALGMRLSSGGRSRAFPFGRGREQFFWSFVVAMGTATLSSAFSILEGVEKLIYGEELRDLWIALVVVLVGLILEGTALRVSFASFERARRSEGFRSRLAYVRSTRNTTLLAALFEDVASVSGLLVALSALLMVELTGDVVYDAIGSIAVGAILATFGLLLAREARGLLIGEGLSRAELERVIEVVASHPAVARVMDVSGTFLGVDSAILGVEVNFRDGMTTDEIEGAVNEIESMIRRVFPQAKYVYVEAEEPSARPGS